MSTYSKIIYHLVFSTKFRSETLGKDQLPDLYRFIWGFLRNKKCSLYRIGGACDHLHILFSMPTDLAPASLVRDLKLASSAFLKSTNLFPGFNGWQNGYGIFSCSGNDIGGLIQYIKNQEDHHKKKSSREEIIELLKEHGIKFDLKYLE